MRPSKGIQYSNMEENNKDSIHSILAHSYLSYFVFSFIGLFADILIGFDVHLPHANTIAVICFVIGTIMVIWAQNTSGKEINKTGKDIGPYFTSGPYKYLRNPTHLGIVLLVAGYTVVSGSIVFLTLTLVGYLVSNVFFKRYEDILHIAYGDKYKEYKKKVPKIL